MTCKICNGSGEIIHQENQSPIGSGMIWLEDIVDDCPGCTEMGLCPGCNKMWDEDTFELYTDCAIGISNEFICPFCNWTHGEVI